MRTFEAVTGPKPDDWPVRTVGLLAISFGAVLARERPGPVPGAAAALPSATVSAWCGGRGSISRIYLADAAVELGFVAGWVAVALQPSRAEPAPRATTPADAVQHLLGRPLHPAMPHGIAS